MRPAGHWSFATQAAIDPRIDDPEMKSRMFLGSAWLSAVLVLAPVGSVGVVVAAGGGELDPAFAGGSVTTAIGTAKDVAYSVAVQDDGRIVVAGNAAVEVT